MKSIFSCVRRVLAPTVAIFAVALGLTGCANEVGTELPGDNVYDIAVSTDGHDIAMKVNVSEAAAIEYEQLNQTALDKEDVGVLVEERIRRAIDEGLIEMPTDPNAQIDIVFDVKQKEGVPGLRIEGDTCVVSWGTASYYYKIVIRDSYGCRYYDAYDYYDILHNNCNNTNTLQYLNSKQYGPYWGC